MIGGARSLLVGLPRGLRRILRQGRARRRRARGPLAGTLLGSHALALALAVTDRGQTSFEAPGGGPPRGPENDMC